MYQKEPKSLKICHLLALFFFGRLLITRNGNEITTYVSYRCKKCKINASIFFLLIEKVAKL